MVKKMKPPMRFTRWGSTWYLIMLLRKKEDAKSYKHDYTYEGGPPIQTTIVAFSSDRYSTKDVTEIDGMSSEKAGKKVGQQFYGLYSKGKLWYM